MMLTKELVSINDFDTYGWTPLFWAVDGGHVDTIRVLLRSGADVNRGREGWTALMWACGGASAEEIAKIFLGEFGADPNAASLNGKTAIMVASSAGNTAVVNILIGYRAQVDVPDKEGNTALTLATSEGHVEVMDTLLAAGANVSTVGPHQRPLLMTAAALGNVQVASRLLQAGASLAQPAGEDGATALMVAAERGQKSMVNLFLTHDADVNAMDVKNTSALARASRAGKAEVAQLLIELGAVVDAPDYNLWTSLMHAAARGHDVVMAVLLAAGADVHFQSTAGETAVELHSMFGTGGAPALKSQIRATLDLKAKETWNSVELGMFLCSIPAAGRHLCRWAPPCRRAGLTGAHFFVDDSRYPPRSALTDASLSLLEDPVQVLRWAARRNLTSLIDVLLAPDSGVSLNINEAFVFATKGTNDGLVERLAQHPALDVHAMLPTINRTAIELVPKSSTGGQAVRERVRARLHLGNKDEESERGGVERRGSAVENWNTADVLNWMVLHGATTLLDVVRDSNINGSHLLQLASEKEIANVGVSLLADFPRVLQWALSSSLPAVLLGLALRPQGSALLTLDLQGEGRNLLEHPALAEGGTMGEARPQLLDLVRMRQRSIPLEQWTVSHVVNWMHVLEMGHLGVSTRADGIAGPQLLPLLRLASPTSSEASHTNSHRALDARSATWHSDGTLLIWSFTQRHRHLATQLAETARRVHTAEGFGCWVALHSELAGLDLTPLEVAEEEGWAEAAAVLRPLVGARLASVPLQLWSHVDVVNYLLTQNRTGLASAARSCGPSLTGASLHLLAFSPSELSKLLDSAGGQSVVLKWALEQRHEALANSILASVPADREPWPGSGPPLEVATLYALDSGLPVLQSSALTLLRSYSSMADWPPLAVSSWLTLNHCKELAPSFRQEGVSGAQLARLGETPNTSLTQSTEAAVSLAINDERLRLVWTAKENLGLVMATFLGMLSPEQTGPVLLDEYDGVPGGGSLLFWIYNNANSKRRILDSMIPSFRNYLARTPVDKWTSAQVISWLLIGGGRKFVQVFQQEQIAGAQLVTLLARVNLHGLEAASSLSGDVLKRTDVVMDWAIHAPHPQIALSLLVYQSNLAHSALPDDTVFGAAKAMGPRLAQVHSELESLVRRRLDPTQLRSLAEQDWTAVDVANWQYIHGQYKFIKALYSNQVDGAKLHQLCKPLNVSVLLDEARVMTWAISRGYSNIVQSLLNSGASPFQADAYGSTSLMDASWQGKAEIVRSLLQAGALVDAQNSNGYTALMRAALRGHTRVAHVLLAFNANVRITNNKGKTASMLAKSKGYIEFSGLLKPNAM
eukprot:CAMPEP_0196575244 /NCGR_PEP_ID=MMETSP1081-20130531/4756_1 /TAXON_ID=36882 /ORGANISM="Pyramimonas amylifera, Strain CCMP720" /LENGTH=1321 /DNA_ID=CAMNT_0041893485 /DNA_START=165 /DNA_END=4130 /DNA_ORIENTATION=+